MKRTLRLNERGLTNLVKRIVNENRNEERQIGAIIDDIISGFEFSQKGNDELINLANYLMEPGNSEKVAQQILSKLKKGYGAHEDDEEGFGVYTSKRDQLGDLERRFSRD
jgi:hypothetical protein